MVLNTTIIATEQDQYTLYSCTNYTSLTLDLNMSFMCSVRVGKVSFYFLLLSKLN